MDELVDELNDMYISDSDIVIESDDETEIPYEYCVLSIDIGVLHLGISVTTLDKEYNIIEIIFIDLINITDYIHNFGPDKKKCQLHHTKTFTDWMNHTYQENMDFFYMADYILVERQPPMGFVVVEQLIFSRWREKTILISPNSMHKFFIIGDYDYDKRKVYTEKIALMYLKDPELVTQLGFYDRAHDITDSICIMLYWIHGKQEEYKQNARKKYLMERQTNVWKNGKNMTTEEWFESYRYVPHI